MCLEMVEKQPVIMNTQTSNSSKEELVEQDVAGIDDIDDRPLN